MRSNRVSKSVSAERTFDSDERDMERLKSELERVAGFAWDRIERAQVAGRTVTLKVKYADFEIITRSRSVADPVRDRETFLAEGLTLLQALDPLPKGVRLLGLGLHNLCDRETAAPRQLGLAI